MLKITNNTDRLYSALTDVLQSSHAQYVGNAFYWSDRVNGQSFVADDYHSIWLNPPVKDRVGHLTALEQGRAWVVVQDMQDRELAEQTTSLDYNFFRPGDLSDNGEFMVDAVRAYLGHEPAQDQPVIYRHSEKIVVTEPFEDDFLLGVYNRIATLLRP